MPYQSRYTRTPMPAYPKRYAKKAVYPKRKYPLQVKNFQSPYELSQASARTARTAQQVQLY